MFDKSETITKLAVSLIKAQKAIMPATKDATNPHYRSKYADLTAIIDAVKGPLNDNGIAFLQVVNATPAVETILLHESGEWMSSVTPVYCGKPNDPQALGSGITYAKRYGLQAMLGLPTEDDDGEAAMPRNKAAEEFEREVINKPPAEPPSKPAFREPTTPERKGIAELITACAEDGYEGLDMDGLKAFLWASYGKYPTNREQADKILSHAPFRAWLTR